MKQKQKLEEQKQNKVNKKGKPNTLSKKELNRKNSILKFIESENQKNLYDSCLTGDRYIGPRYFVSLSNKSGQETLLFKISKFDFIFELSSIIITGIPQELILLSDKYEKKELPEFKNGYNVKNTYFLPFDIGCEVGFGKKLFKQPANLNFTEMGQMDSGKVLLFLQKFKKSKDSTQQCPEIILETRKEISDFFALLNCKILNFFCHCKLNFLMFSEDYQSIANLIFSHYILKSKKDIEICKFYQQNNHPPKEFRCEMRNLEILKKLIRLIRNYQYKMKYANGSRLCLFKILYENIAIKIYVTKDKKNKAEIIEVNKEDIKIKIEDCGIKIEDCHESWRKLENINEENPQFTIQFQCGFGFKGRNIISNLLRMYSNVHKKSKFVQENDWEVVEFYREENDAPLVLTFDFMHSDVILAFFKRLQMDAKKNGWNGNVIGKSLITFSNSRMTAISIGFL